MKTIEVEFHGWNITDIYLQYNTLDPAMFTPYDIYKFIYFIILMGSNAKVNHNIFGFEANKIDLVACGEQIIYK